MRVAAAFYIEPRKTESGIARKPCNWPVVFARGHFRNCVDVFRFRMNRLMRFRCRRSPRAVIMLVCGCTLVSLFLFQRNIWRDYATQGQSAEEQFVAKYVRLRPLMPTDEVARFVVDEGHADLNRLHRDARMYLAQYAVSPRRLARDVASRWVVVDSDDPDSAPEIATSAHWTLLADLHNGVHLYRTDLGE